MISTVVVTRNDATLLPYCLGSLTSWVDEIVVIDMHSVDETRNIARGFNARVIDHQPVDYVEPVRVFSIGQCRGDWIMIMDPDEVVPVQLARELVAVAIEDAADVVLVPRSNYLFGAPMRFSGWGAGQDWHNRFFKREMLTFSDVIHSLPLVKTGARTVAIDATEATAIAHFSYLDVTQFVEKLNRYTSAAVEGHVGSSRRLGRTIIRSVREVWTRLVRHRGYRDGWRGAVGSVLMVTSHLVEWGKQREASEGWGRAAALERYEAEAAELVRQHTA